MSSAGHYRYLFTPAADRPADGPQPDRLLGPPDQLRRGRAAHRPARRLLRGRGRQAVPGSSSPRSTPPTSPTGPTRSSSTASTPRSSPATGASPRPSTPTTCPSSPRSTTTAARRRACTRACRCGLPAPSPTRSSARSPRRSRPMRSGRSWRATPPWLGTASPAVSTGSSCSAPIRRSSVASCRRPPTAGPTTTGAHSPIGPGCSSRSSTPSGRPSAPTTCWACASAATS